MTEATTTEQRLIAIVDDDASVRQSTRRLVRSFGYHAEAYGSAEEYLAADVAETTACLLLDVRMPGMDGLELQRRLADAEESVPIVFLTALASDDEERRARQAGAFQILRKPVAKDVLLKVLEAALAAPRSPRRKS